jgi:holliday junction DNA helicase RuvA
MIAFLRGTVLRREISFVVIESHDIGYRVSVPERIAEQCVITERCELYISHVIREDSSELYGFCTIQELELFEQLLSVSGVGPRTALALVGTSAIERLIQAIAKGESGLLKSVSGVGAKTAERIIVELRDKCKARALEMSVVETSGDAELIDALVSLGYPQNKARETVDALDPIYGPIEERLRAALKILGSSVK